MRLDQARMRGRLDEMTMKKLIMAVIFALIALVTARNVQAETWCLRNFGDPPNKDCVSAPLQYCLRGLAAGGGICVRDRSYLERSNDRDPSQRPSRRRLAN
jgi:hypothetical protein